MKLFAATFVACLAFAVADVSHLNLNRQYLPPDNGLAAAASEEHHQHHHHHEEHQHHHEEHVAQPEPAVHLSEESAPAAVATHHVVAAYSHEEAAAAVPLIDVPVPQPAEAASVQEAYVEPEARPQPAVFQPAAPVYSAAAATPVRVAAPAPEYIPPAPVVEEVVSNGIDTQYGSNGGYIY